jgi:1-acyl-sn-glycerol-3-phosphate acyltransferase
VQTVDWEQLVANGLACLTRRLNGQSAVADLEFDRDVTERVLAPPLRFLYDKWFRVETRGFQHVPKTGPALVVANHAGVLPFDGIMLALAFLDHNPSSRPLRILAADLVFKTPLLGEIARKAGFVLADVNEAHQLLTSGELVGVFPEGYKGVGKPYHERYKLQRFGRAGFITTALRAQAPIVPCAIIGSEEIYPKIGEIKLLARAFGLPYFPVTPLFPWLGPLGLVPLPSKWIIQFAPPIDVVTLAAEENEDAKLNFRLAGRVRKTIQQSLDTLLAERKSAFSTAHSASKATE